MEKIDLSLIPIKELINEINLRYKDSGYVFAYFDPTNKTKDALINTYWADNNFANNVALCEILKEDVFDEGRNYIRDV